MRQESQIELNHAVISATLVRDISTALSAMLDGKSNWSGQVTSLVDRINEIIEETPDMYVPSEWKVMLAGLRALDSQLICLTIAQSGEGDLVMERARCDTLIGELRRLITSASLKLFSPM